MNELWTSQYVQICVLIIVQQCVHIVFCLSGTFSPTKMLPCVRFKTHCNFTNFVTQFSVLPHILWHPPLLLYYQIHVSERSAKDNGHLWQLWFPLPFRSARPQLRSVHFLPKTPMSSETLESLSVRHKTEGTVTSLVTKCWSVKMQGKNEHMDFRIHFLYH